MIEWIIIVVDIDKSYTYIYDFVIDVLTHDNGVGECFVVFL